MISVIIPLYNAEKFIAKALESCLNLPEIKEIIVIDDGFRDNATNIVRTYTQKYSFIKLFQHPNNENKGAGASRNLGILKATQDYIAFLDADDFFLSNRFEKDTEVFNQHKDAEGCYNAIGTHFYSEKAKKMFKDSRIAIKTSVNDTARPNPNNLYLGLLGMISNFGYYSLDGLTIKRNSLLESSILFDDLRIHQDTIFAIKTAKKMKIYPSNINEVVAMRGVHEENRITANNNSDEHIRGEKRYKMWQNILDWSYIEEENEEVKKYIKNQRDYYYYISKHTNNPYYFFKEIFQNPRILQLPNYIHLHKKYFGNLTFSHILYRIINRYLILFTKKKSFIKKH